MTQEILMNALSSMEGEFLDEALCARAKLLPRAGRRIKSPTVKWMSVAACLVAVLLAIPYAKLVFSGSHSGAPESKFYASAEAVEAAFGEDLLLERLDSVLPRTRDIHVTFPNDQNGTHQRNHPLTLEARYTMTKADNSLDTVVCLYILFDRDSIDDSYLGGYEEQGLTRRYGEITVHYSLIEDPLMHGQAKFLYGGNLYILDVQSTGDTHFLMKYLDILLGEEGAS